MHEMDFHICSLSLDRMFAGGVEVKLLQFEHSPIHLGKAAVTHNRLYGVAVVLNFAGLPAPFQSGRSYVGFHSVLQSYGGLFSIRDLG